MHSNCAWRPNKWSKNILMNIFPFFSWQRRKRMRFFNVTKATNDCSEGRKDEQSTTKKAEKLWQIMPRIWREINNYIQHVLLYNWSQSLYKNEHFPLQGLLWHHIANLLWAQTDLILAQVNKSTRGSENHFLEVRLLFFFTYVWVFCAFHPLPNKPSWT